MLKTCVLALAFLAVSAADLYAQTDNFVTEAACQAAVQNQSFQFYRPSVITRRTLAANEVVLAHPTGGCFDMLVPDRIGGRRWVPIEEGQLFVYDRANGGILRLSECDNPIYAESPFGGARPESNPFTNFRQDSVVTAPTIRDSADRLAQETILNRQPIQQRTEIDIDRGGMPGWLKAVLIGGAIVGTGYVIYQCVKEGGFCHNDVNVSQIVDLSGNGGPGITVTQR